MIHLQHMKPYVFAILLLAALFWNDIQPHAAAQAPFQKGVNLTGWFQAGSAHSIQFRKYSKKDFADIKSLGCDVIRLPVNLHAMTDGTSDYLVDPLLFMFLDSAVQWAEELNLHLIIDNHSFDPSVNTSPSVVNILTKVWPQLALRYKDRSHLIYYEVLNEPHGISNALWGSIQQQTIDAIRAVDQKHTIIVGPSGYNSYNDLSQMPVYTDTNLLYTFHFYDPFVFTHQGASWVEPSMQPLAGVPFPYDADSMPACPPSLQGSWIESALNNYMWDGTADKVKSLIDVAIAFREQRNVPVFCGEFGVYIPNSHNDDRVEWYHLVRSYLESNNIPWTIWDYKGGFGLFEKDSGELFEHHLNIPLVEALGFMVPEQTLYVPYADSTGFILFDDFIGAGISEASWAPDTLDFYNETYPNNGAFCLYMAGGDQYHSVAFDFQPNRDLHRLVDSAYALDFLIRGNVPGIALDLRFLDTKTGPDDHPWRIKTTVNSGVVPFDKRWHHLHIPLSAFVEQGSWDNNVWYNPQGLFDWTAIDRFEIVAEHGSLDGQQIWFDNICINQLDTAMVHETATLGILSKSEEMLKVVLAPNPFRDQTSITFHPLHSGTVTIEIRDFQQLIVAAQIIDVVANEPELFIWNGTNLEGQQLDKGVYVLSIRNRHINSTVKLIKI